MSYFFGSAGEIKVGATRRFLLFGSSCVVSPAIPSPSRFAGATGAGVSGGVDNSALVPVDEILAFRFDDPVFTTVGCANVDVGDGAESAMGGMVDILAVEAKGETVAMEEDEFERVGLVARTGGVGKEGFEIVEGEGRERGREESGVGAGPGWISPSSPGSKRTVEQNPSVEVMINILPSVDLSS
jgi:hypothetical protein